MNDSKIDWEINIKLNNLTATILRMKDKRWVLEYIWKDCSIIGKYQVDLGVTSTIERKIDLQRDTLIKQPYRGFAPPMQIENRCELEKIFKD